MNGRFLRRCLDQLRGQGSLTPRSSNRLQKLMEDLAERENKPIDENITDRARRAREAQIDNLRGIIGTIEASERELGRINAGAQSGVDPRVGLMESFIFLQSAQTRQPLPPASLHIVHVTQELKRELHENGNLVNILSSNDPNRIRGLFREMRHPGTSAEAGVRDAAKHTTRVLNGNLEIMRERGLNIRPIDNYIPQNIDPSRLHDKKISYEEAENLFSQRLEMWIDFEAMKDSNGIELSPTGRSELYSEIFRDLSRDMRPQLGSRRQNFGDNSPNSRILHFRGFEQWEQFHTHYGEGSIIDLFDRHVNYVGRIRALVEKYGPNPQATFDTMLEHVQNLQHLFNRNLVSDTIANNFNFMARHVWDELTQRKIYPSSPRIALLGSALRNVSAALNLGRATVTAVGDFGTSHIQARRIEARGFSALFGPWLRRFLSPAAERMSRELAQHMSHEVQLHGEALKRNMNSIIIDQQATYGVEKHKILGKIQRGATALRDFTLTWTGLHRTTRISKDQAYLRVANAIGEGVQREFNSLGAGLRRLLDVHNISPENWRTLRMAVETADRVDYINIERIADLELRARTHGLMLGHVERSVVESTVFTNAFFRVFGRDSAGPVTDVTNEFFIRPLFQFKSFAMSQLLNIFDQFRIGGANNFSRTVAFATSAAQMAVAGMAITILKEIGDGKFPDYENLDKWFFTNLRRFNAEGGYFPFLGDFIDKPKQFFSFVTSNNSAIGEFTNFVIEATSSIKEGEFGDPISRAVARSPGANFFYTRLVIRRLLEQALENHVNTRSRNARWNRIERDAREHGEAWWWAQR